LLDPFGRRALPMQARAPSIVVVVVDTSHRSRVSIIISIAGACYRRGASLWLLLLMMRVGRVGGERRIGCRLVVSSDRRSISDGLKPTDLDGLGSIEISVR
jgi:hypothetical protein